MYDHATALRATSTKHDVRQQDAPLPETGDSVRRVSYMLGALVSLQWKGGARAVA